MWTSSADDFWHLDGSPVGPNPRAAFPKLPQGRGLSLERCCGSGSRSADVPFLWHGPADPVSAESLSMVPGRGDSHFQCESHLKDKRSVCHTVRCAVPCLSVCLSALSALSLCLRCLTLYTYEFPRGSEKACLVLSFSSNELKPQLDTQR